MEGFVHLAARTCFSLREGVIRPRELAEATARMGMTAVGVADRGGLYGAVRLAQACEAVGVRPIFGADLALAPAPRRGWQARRPGRVRTVPRPASGAGWLHDDAARVTLIARTRRGYANLCRTVSAHHLESERGDPHVTWQQLGQRVGGGGRGDHGLFVLLGDDSPVARLLDTHRPDAAAAEARRWMDLAGPSSVLVGVTHHLASGDDARARTRFRLADRLGLRTVAHQAARYLEPADALLADALDAVRKQTPLHPRHSARRNAEGYLKTRRQMAAVFAERPDALANTAWAADACEVDLGIGRLRVPDLVAVGEAADARLRVRCEAGVRERYERPGRRHRERLEAELAMTAQLGLASFFLTVAEIVERIRAKRIIVACRGSAAGSLLTYALRISDVDPIAHGLCFERFMNPYRDELPDIDIDVESARRHEIYRDLLDAYGEDRIACVAMVQTMRARMALREVGKALGIPAAEIDHIARSFPHIRAGDVRPALAVLPELAGRNLDRPDLRLLFDLAARLDGIPRQIALHPCGVLLDGAGLRDLVPMERSAQGVRGSPPIEQGVRGSPPIEQGVRGSPPIEQGVRGNPPIEQGVRGNPPIEQGVRGSPPGTQGFVMAQFDKDDVAALGLCKLDVLGVRMLSSMAHAVEEVRRVRGVEVDLQTVPWDDEPTFELIRTTRTLGMFQIESPGQRELIGKLQPEHFADLIVDISLFRPGPVRGDMVAPFLRRRLGRRPEAGTVAPRSRAVGDAAWVSHPLLRPALGETFGVIVYHEQVMRVFAAMTGCDLARADQVRRQLGDPGQRDGLRAEFLDGARARSVPDPVASQIWDALEKFASFGFCKAHAAAFAVPTYRSAWLKTHYLPEFFAGLLTHDPGMYPRRLLLADARRFGVAVLPLDVNRSGREYRVERLPGVRTGDAVYGIRIGLQDVAGIDDRMIDSVLAERPFSSIEDLRRRSALSAPVAEALAHVGALDGLAAASSRRDVLLMVTEQWSGDGSGVRDAAARPSGLDGYTAGEQVRAELEVLGFEVAGHVMHFYKDLLAVLGVVHAEGLLDCRSGQRVRVAGVKVATQTPPVRSGQRVIFLSLDDVTGVSDAAFFESVHDRCARTVFHAWLLMVEGTVRRTGRRGVSINADHAWDLSLLMRAWRQDRLDDALASPTLVDDLTGPPRKLWHASAGSAGR